MKDHLIALDQGTTSSRAIVFDQTRQERGIAEVEDLGASHGGRVKIGGSEGGVVAGKVEKDAITTPRRKNDRVGT